MVSSGVTCLEYSDAAALLTGTCNMCAQVDAEYLHELILLHSGTGPCAGQPASKAPPVRHQTSGVSERLLPLQAACSAEPSSKQHTGHYQVDVTTILNHTWQRQSTAPHSMQRHQQPSQANTY